MSYNYNPNALSEGLTVDKDNGTMLDKAINAVTMPFAGDDVLHTSDEVLYSAVMWTAAGFIGGGMLARKRESENKDAIFGFIA